MATLGPTSGTQESKGLFTRCALHPKQDFFRGREPVPRLKFHPKEGVWRKAPYTTPRPDSAPALALGQARQHPGPRGSLAVPATVRPNTRATLVLGLRGQRQNPRSVFSLPRRGLQALSAGRGRATFPRFSATAGSRTSYRNSLHDSSSLHPCPRL